MEFATIPYGKHVISNEDIDFVINVLNSDFLTQGPQILEFEKKFSEYVGCKFSVAVSNGTAALHLATLALGITKGDKIITTPITFAASANCIRYSEGEVIFCDIDPLTYLMDLNKLEELLIKHPKGTFKGVIPVDFAGQAINLEKLRELADRYNLWIIEDACHAPGGFFVDSKGLKQKCGNGVFSDVSVFSFHPVKHIATGEGGMITTNNELIYNKLLELRTHGITKNPETFLNNIDIAFGEKDKKKYPGWYMEMQSLGFNYRFTDFQAALGSSQLNRANEGLIRRREIAKIYNDAFLGEHFIIGQSGHLVNHAYHLYIVEVKDRSGLYEYLKTKGILTQVHYFPCHLMPYYKQFGWKFGDFPISEQYYSRCLSIPMYPSLSDKEILYVIKTIKNYYV